MSYVFYGRQRLDCLPGTVNEGNGALTDVLYVQGSAGGADRTVEATTDDITSLVVLAPPAGGNGKFVIHADVGCPEATLQSALPADIGITCFPFLLPQGAKPVIVANNVGKANLVGESNFFGEATADPDRAPTAFFYEGLPIGMTVTFQGIIVDPASLSPQSASTTNAVTLMVVP